MAKKQIIEVEVTETITKKVNQHAVVFTDEERKFLKALFGMDQTGPRVLHANGSMDSELKLHGFRSDDTRRLFSTLYNAF